MAVRPALSPGDEWGAPLLAWLDEQFASKADQPVVHPQATPAATWTISHGLGRVPHAVTLYVGGEVVDTDTHVDAASVVLTFPTPTAGEAHIL